MSDGARADVTRTRWTFVLALPGLWVFAVLAWELSWPSSGQLLQLLAAAPAIACAGTGRRLCVVMGGLCALLALVPFDGAPPIGPGLPARAVNCAAILTVVCASYLTAGRRLRLVRELVRAREVAATAQRALLPPLPPRIGTVAPAALHLSADEGASMGGDLYDVVATRYGVRAVIGDVRGHGLAALATVAAMLGCFREAAHDEAELSGLLGRLERAHARHLAGRDPATDAAPLGPDAEEFVTILLLEIAPDGTARALNCGHPWPYRVAPGVVEPVVRAEPLPPLGLFPLPRALETTECGRLTPGEGLLLYTDGAHDARGVDGGFFPLVETVRRFAGARADAVVGGVHDALLRHARGRLTDDVALVMLSAAPPRASGPAPSGPASSGPAPAAPAPSGPGRPAARVEEPARPWRQALAPRRPAPVRPSAERPRSAAAAPRTAGDEASSHPV
ncbi:PP2C family protein-serine/threonine phosphatase [Streptomyces catenulae]|uniref:PP2C family protein-serine/threonine phosphatase n=1 Tax=Streptomyces catenulae TaxID=66875 RepID=A0ABV2Z0L2_9ACTN|nr:PP2C family protein-serine/threonine phosphatase [Streptomyces catenulae]